MCGQEKVPVLDGQEVALGLFLPPSFTFVTSPHPTNLSLARSMKRTTVRIANSGDMSGPFKREQDSTSKISGNAQDSGDSTIGGESSKDESEQTSEKTGDLPVTTKGYSAEARTYHARYDEVLTAPASDVTGNH